MNSKKNNAVFWWAALGFVFLLSGWTAIFTLSARVRPAEIQVPRVSPHP